MSKCLRWVVIVALVGLSAAAVGCGGVQQEQAKGGIVWTHDYEAGMAAAREADKPVMVDVFATWCAPCKLLDENVFSRDDVAAASQDFVTIKVDGDEHPDTKEKLGVSGYPTILFLTPEGEEIGRSVGAVSYNVMLTEMQKAKERYAAGS